MFTLFYHYCTNLMHTHTVCIEKKQIAKLQHYEVDNVWQMSSVWKAAPHLQTYQTYWLPKQHSSIRFGIISYPCHISQNSKVWDVHLCVHIMKTSIELSLYKFTREESLTNVFPKNCILLANRTYWLPPCFVNIIHHSLFFLNLLNFLSFRLCYWIHLEIKYV